MQGLANGSDAPPVLLNQYQVDKLTAWHAVQATLGALFARSAGKARGQHVEVSMLDVGLSFFFPDGMGLTGEQMVGGESTYEGKPSRRPAQVLMKTKDGHAVMMVRARPCPASCLFSQCM
jgi:crotonobetainyl-CoA:carnitine CoA-transferase CaiB-like acyl-CoA transferase